MSPLHIPPVGDVVSIVLSSFLQFFVRIASFKAAPQPREAAAFSSDSATPLLSFRTLGKDSVSERSASMPTPVANMAELLENRDDHVCFRSETLQRCGGIRPLLSRSHRNGYTTSNVAEYRRTHA